MIIYWPYKSLLSKTGFLWDPIQNEDMVFFKNKAFKSGRRVFKQSTHSSINNVFVCTEVAHLTKPACLSLFFTQPALKFYFIFDKAKPNEEGKKQSCEARVQLSKLPCSTLEMIIKEKMSHYDIKKCFHPLFTTMSWETNKNFEKLAQ